MYKAVIDSNGFFIAFVRIVGGNPFEYELKQGECLIDDLSFQGMIQPKWNGFKWIETGNAPPVIQPAKNSTEIQLEFLGQQNTDRELENIAQGQKITDLELSILALKGGSSNVK